MKIYSADTWTIEELQALLGDAGRRALLVPAAETMQAVLETFAATISVEPEDGLDLDALNDSLHDFADSVSDDGLAPVTFIWQVPAVFRADRSFGIICEVLQDAERYAGQHLDFIAVCL
ncbi:RNAse (barnase) inhibitor barstar [Arthrobacter sp. V4I6]|uniref:barstar family protein n=1 Tax=unclassified Arthrobacter TaxID=235627 RepID=UPI0027844392|nr:MULTISPECIES: barnase inhibitor [unclassified Arthrobacter]MDQ0822725.1 RNAse (barnase) inhibitor barstar [Arthrobacter sp. V1I7]MDQ0852353.1 RNAse (barnase) inhibitor barstar [Arthrobacter sp. V4I6]